MCFNINTFLYYFTISNLGYSNSWCSTFNVIFILQLKERCRKGIPPAVRGMAWKQLCGATKLKEDNPGLFGVYSTSVAGVIYIHNAFSW